MIEADGDLATRVGDRPAEVQQVAGDRPVLVVVVEILLRALLAWRQEHNYQLSSGYRVM